MMRDPEKTVGNLIDKVSISQICYTDSAGYPVTRAMLPPRERDGIKTFLFTTNTSSEKVNRFREDGKASIYFVDRRFYRAVSLQGKMEVLETRDVKERVWRDGDERFYPAGAGDPDYCVLKFTAESGVFYSNFNSQEFEIK